MFDQVASVPSAENGFNWTFAAMASTRCRTVVIALHDPHESPRLVREPQRATPRGSNIEHIPTPATWHVSDLRLHALYCGCLGARRLFYLYFGI